MKEPKLLHVILRNRDFSAFDSFAQEFRGNMAPSKGSTKKVLRGPNLSSPGTSHCVSTFFNCKISILYSSKTLQFLYFKNLPVYF